MRRREFITLVFGAAVARPDTARAQQPASRVPCVGYLFSFTPAEGRHLWDACRRGLRELGYVEGQNIVLEPRWADGHHERLGQLAAELAGLKVDVIVSAATPASRAAKAATSSIPIVIVAVGEPVKTGLVASLARPGGNVTGLSLLTSEMSGKRLELLAAIAGNVRSVAIMMNPDNPVHAVFWDETRAAAQTSGFQLQLLKARNPSEIEDAFNAVTRDRAAALIVFDDPVIWSHRVQVVALAAKRRLPVMYGLREFVDDGGLMSYGPDRVDHYRRTAIYVDKILKGAKTADLAVEQPTKFEFVINLKTAKALNLAVPPLLLAQANEVIE
jgi:putative ABC transport system substrate-binding protein